MISRASTSFTSDRLLRWRLTHLFNSWDFSPLLCFSFDPGGKRLRAAVKGLYHENFCYWPLGSMSTSKFTILYLSDCFQLKPDEFAASQGRPQQPFRLFCSVSANPTPSPSYPTSLKTSQWNPCLDTSSLNKSWAFSTLKVQTKLEPGRLLKEEVRLIRKTPFCFFFFFLKKVAFEINGSLQISVLALLPKR